MAIPKCIYDIEFINDSDQKCELELDDADINFLASMFIELAANRAAKDQSAI